MESSFGFASDADFNSVARVEVRRLAFDLVAVGLERGSFRAGRRLLVFAAALGCGLFLDFAVGVLGTSFCFAGTFFR